MSEASHNEPHVEEHLLKHLNGLSYGIKQWSAKEGERAQCRQEIEKHILEMNALIPNLAPAKMIDAYNCLEKIQEGSRWVFLEINDFGRTHEAMTAISGAYQDFVAILNWKVE